MLRSAILLVWWLPAAIWALVYTSDMALTLAGARSYKRLEGKFFHFESYELTPFWKTTIERGKALTPRFALALVFSTATVGALGWLSSLSGEQGEPALLFGFGALFLTEAAVHLRHLRNLFLFRTLARGESGVEGMLRYPAAFSYRMSATELVTFAVVYGIAAAVEESFFWSGGAMATLLLALRHLAYAKSASRRAAASATTA